MVAEALQAWGLEEQTCEVIPFGSGLINHTWKINHQQQSYILQRINHQVFRQPEGIAANIDSIGNYLAQQHPSWLFVHPVKTTRQEPMLHSEQHGYFRLFPFVKNSHTIDVVNTTEQAYEAAAQFGRFTQSLSGFNASRLHTTLPDFHNLLLRFANFLQAINQPGGERKKKAAPVISFLSSQKYIVEAYQRILQNPAFKLRVTHHDTKISNVLFDDNDKGICVIDLDTVMPGYFISDVGDMMRTYLCPVSEEEQDFTKIEIRNNYFSAIVEGYLSYMQQELTNEEKKYFVYAGKFMIFMQAIRFLTDYLNNDVYYGQKYEGHNLIRATNQATLLQRLLDKEAELEELVENKRKKPASHEADF